MKFRINLKLFTLSAMLLASSLIFISCEDDDDEKCCAGYTGEVTNEQSLKLVNKCHFLSQDSIELWTKNYEDYKKRLGSDNDTVAIALDRKSAGFLRSSSLSFNSCIIKKLIAHEKSIGLRVLYGIGGDNRIHIILVGINAGDYSNLYIQDAETCCDKSINKKLVNGLSGANPSYGGAEYGQMP